MDAIKYPVILTAVKYPPRSDVMVTLSDGSVNHWNGLWHRVEELKREFESKGIPHCQIDEFMELLAQYGAEGQVYIDGDNGKISF